MKPIKLKIDGINSYYNEAVIDFEELTSMGIFGIFGKTGCGKSTILDAMTLALYGNIPRKTKEFINSGREKGSVEYEFEIGEGSERSRYTVMRSFKKSRKGSKISSVSDRVLLKKKNQGGDFEILAEKVNELNSKIMDILGLSESDFLKSVVLPQGKFGEFLSLSGKDRRDMLERIFNLEDYGSNLSIKLNLRKRKVDSEINALEAKLAEYPDVGYDTKKEMEKEYSYLEKSSIKQKEELELLRTNMEKDKALYSMIVEKTEKKSRLEKLEASGEEIENKKKIYERATNTYYIMPVIEKSSSLEKSISDGEKRIEETENNVKSLKMDKDGFEREFSVYESLRLDSSAMGISDMQINIIADNMKKADEEKIILEDINTKKKELENRKKLIKTSMEELSGRIKEIEMTTAGLDEKIKSNKVDATLKEMLINGLGMISEKNRLNTKIGKLKEEVLNEKKTSQILKEELDICRKKEKQLDEEYEKILESEKSLKKNDVPDDALYNELESIRVELGRNAKDAIDFNEEILSWKKKQYEKREKLEKDEKTLKNKSDQYRDISNEIEKLKELNREADIGNMVMKIRHHITENHLKSCPVCKSNIGEYYDFVYEEKKLDLEKQEKLEKEKEKIQKDISDFQMGVKYGKEEISAIDGEIKKLYSKIREKLSLEGIVENEITSGWNKFDDSYTVEENIKRFISSGKNLKKYLEEQEKAKREIKKKEEELLGAKEKNMIEKNEAGKMTILKKTALESLLSNLTTKEVEILELEKESQNISQNISEIMKSISSDNLEETYKSVKTKEDIYIRAIDDKEKFAKEMDILRKKADNLREEQALAEGEINRENSRIEVVISAIEKMEKENSSIADKIDMDFIKRTLFKLYSKENTDFEGNPFESREKLENISSSIKCFLRDVEEGFERAKNRKEEALSKFEKANMILEKTRTELELNRRQHAETLDDIRILADKYGFDGIDEVLQSYLDEDRTQKIREEIEGYEKTRLELKNSIVELDIKIDGRSITFDEIENKEESLKSRTGEYEETRAEMSKLGYKIDVIKQTLKTTENLRAKLKDEMQKKNDISILENVLKGNRFVEYLSQIYLRNIVIEASKRLREITNGRYDLEIDSNFMFVIRDNANGGIRRSADTLSGGETFLTSLSLALALSSQIQLKGSAPLEFFFLDEGFGTLDPALLDTVMGSLEKLHSERLSVGIISHVEELKSRLPKKLIVELDDVMNSSKTRIE